MAGRATFPLYKAFTTAGIPLNGGKLYTYKAGTVSTALTTYQDEGATTPHTNPIILDSIGEAEIFITEPAKFVLKDSADVLIDETDDILPWQSTTDTSDWYTETGSGNSYVVAVTPVLVAYADGFMVEFLASHANTGATTLDAGPGPVSMVSATGNALIAGEIALDSVISTVYVASKSAFYIKSKQTVTEKDILLSDNTTNNVSSTKHGFLPKLDADATHFFSSDGTQKKPTVTEGEIVLADVATLDVSTSKHGFAPKGSRVITETYSSSTSWYRKYTDGWIEQGGKGTYATDTTITFPVAFLAGPPTVHLTVDKSATEYHEIPGVGGVTATNFIAAHNLTSGGAYTGLIYWSACGYYLSV